MRRVLLLLASISLRLLQGDTATVYVGDGAPHAIAGIATDSVGNTYVAGSRTIREDTGVVPSNSVPDSTDVFVAKLDAATNARIWIRYLPGRNFDTVAAIALDPDGNIYVGGVTNSPDFPLPIPARPPLPSAFLLKLSNDGSRVLWSMSYGQPDAPLIRSLAFAPDRMLVVSGTKTVGSFGDTTGFVGKVDPIGNRIVWEREFAGTQLTCTGGSSCFLSARRNDVVGVDLDAAGNIVVGGNSNTTDFPTSAGALLEHGYGPYVRKFGPAGDLLWSTYLSNNRVGSGTLVAPADTLSAIGVDTSGSVYLAGGGSAGWPVSVGAYRTQPDSSPSGTAFAARLNANGTAFVYSTFLAPDAAGVPRAIAADRSGNAWVSGGTLAGFLLSYGLGQPDYLVQVNAAGTALLRDQRFPDGSRGATMAIDRNGGIHVSSAETGLITVLSPVLPSSGLYGVANAAGIAATGRVAAGELISIYGWAMGDRVYFNETPGVILYASPDQINTIVPFDVRVGDRLTVTVRSGSLITASAVVAVTAAQPEIFKRGGQNAAALNEDGSLNSDANPAKAGSIVALWGTGASGWSQDAASGSTNPLSPLQPLPLGAVVFTSAARVEFAGAAPGLPPGVFQLNVRLPDTLPIPVGVEVQAITVLPVAAGEIGGGALVYVRR